jgi:hypothetical protein
MIANGHFRPPPAIPTLHRGRPRRRPTRGGRAPCREPRRYRPLRRPPRLRPGRASGDHLWSPDRRSRADRLEPTPTFMLRRSETKASGAALQLWPSFHREPVARDGTGAETLGWEHLARHIAARRPRHFDRCGIAGGAGAPSQRKEYRTRQPRPACRPGCRRGNIALRVAVPLRGSPCPLGRAMGSRHVTDG